MPNAMMDFVLVYLNIKEIRTSVAAPNAYLAQTVPEIEPVFEINVLILVQELVAKTHNVMLSITFPYAVVLKTLQEMLLLNVDLYLVRLLNLFYFIFLILLYFNLYYSFFSTCKALSLYSISMRAKQSMS